MKQTRVRLACALAIALLAWLVPVGGAAAAGLQTTGQDAAKVKTFFTCVWHGQTVRLKHITNRPVQNLRDAVIAGRCTNFRTNDKYYDRLTDKSINTFVAYHEYPGLFVVHNALQGKQPVTGAWTFPIGAVPSASVQGTIRDKTTRQPLASATVKAEHCGTSPTRHCITHTVATNQFGHYFIQLYQSGAYTFSFSDTGYATGTKKNVPILLGQSSTMNYSLSSHPGTAVLALAASPATGTVGQTMTLTATVNKPVNDGTIAFTGTGPAGASFTAKACTPAKGVCAITWQPTAAGTWSITASWSGNSTYAAASATTSVTVTGGSTTVTVSATPNPVQAGATTTFTITLGQNVSDGTVTLTGTGPAGATFPTKTCTPTGGTCQITWTPTTVGSWTINASWSGDTANQGGSATTQVTVSQGTVTLTLAANPATPNTGQQTTLTATLSAPVSGGTVTFTGTGPNGATFPSTTCTPTNGTCTASWTPGQSGAWTITASWSGNPNFNVATASLPLTVGTQGTTVTLSVTPSSPGVGKNTLLTATLGSSVTSGNVTFTGTGPNGATFSLTPLSCPVTNGTSCTVVWTPTAPGVWTITANFTGPNGVNGASATTVTVPSQATTLTATASSTSVGVGGSLTLTATLGNSINDGTVTFMGSGPNGQTFVKTCVPTGGTCSQTWVPPTGAGGTWTVKTVWSGDNTYGGLFATDLSLTVTSGTLSLTVNETPNPLPPGTTGTLTATLSNSSINEGTVVFTFLGPNNTPYQSQSCHPVNGTCQVTWSTTTTGDWVITAQWTGTSGTFQPAGNSIHVTVGTGTGITLTQSPTPAILRHAVQVTATVNPNVTGGTVTFTITAPAGGTSPAAQTCTPTNGACSVYFVPDVTGTWTVNAQYVNGSTSASQGGSIVVQSPTGVLNLVLSPNPVQSGSNVTATANLPSSADGNVTFQITNPQGSTTSSSAQAVVGGVASYSFTPNVAGIWQVTATWTGTSGSATDTNMLVVTGLTDTLTLSESPIAPNPGDTVNLVATLSPSNIGGGTISFSALGPNNTAASVTPSTCTPINGTCTVTWSPSVAGTWTITATFSGFGQYGPVTKTLTVNVGSGFLTIDANPNVVQIGSDTIVTAHFQSAITNGMVTFTFKKSDGTTDNAKSCGPNSSSSTSCFVDWTPPSTGTWTITATLTSSTAHPTQETASTQVTVTGGVLTLSAAPNPASLSQTVDNGNATFVVTATLSQPITDNQNSILFFVNAPTGETGEAECYPHNGTCSVDIQLGTGNLPSETGQWTIQGLWSGDDQLPANQNLVTITEQVNS